MDQRISNFKVEKMSAAAAATASEAVHESNSSIVETPNHRQIRVLMEKAVNLGFTIEAIQEALKRIFRSLNVDLSAFLASSSTIDLSKLFDEEKFIELLITVSSQMDNPNASNPFRSNNNNNVNAQDFDHEVDDLDDDFMTTPHQQNGMSFFDFSNNSADFVASANEPSELASTSTSILNKMGFAKPHHQLLQQQLQQQQQRIFDCQNKKAQTIQKMKQEQQEHFIQSMNRINDKSNLRPIIVDSNDVALSSNANKQLFQLHRVLKVVEYFEKRNHPIYVILSSWRKEQIMSSNTVNNSPSPTGTPHLATTTNGHSSPTAASSQPSTPTPDQLALLELEKKNQVYYTPSKRVGTKRIVCDDDSYMLKLAVAKNGIIVSNDNFKRFLNHSDDFKLVIEERVLMYSFIDDTFMPAEDPLGKNGPSLDNFLRFESFVNPQFAKPCPYRKKCTYGSKCKFWHPERALNQAGGGAQSFKSAHQSVLDGVQEQKSKLDALLNQNHQQLPGHFFAAPTQSAPPIAAKPSMAKASFASSAEMSRFDPSQMIRKMGIDNSGLIGKSTVASNLKNNLNMQLLRQQQQQQMKLNLGGDSFFGANTPNLPNFPASIWTDESSLVNGFSSVLDQQENDFLMEKKMSAVSLNKAKAKPAQYLVDSFTETVATAKSRVSDSDDDDDLRSQLMLKLKNAELVDKVMRDHPDERNVEKLSFIAGGYSFDF